MVGWTGCTPRHARAGGEVQHPSFKKNKNQFLSMVLALLDCHSAKTVRAGMQGQTDAAEVMGIVASKDETTHLNIL